ncbi:MAG: hypothetical protein ACYTGG_13645 [Planctomycetota bacterium]
MTEPETNDPVAAAAPDATPGLTPPPPEFAERVSVVTGDRLCAECGYNLTGQPVLREPHYDLLIVRCPECAAVACVQDYPLLGGWSNRLAIVGASLWLLLVLAFAAAVTIPIVATTLGFTFTVSDGYNQTLHELHREWVSEMHPGEDTSRWWNFETFDEWWVLQDPAAVLADAGGVAANINWMATAGFLVPMLLAMLLGGFLSIALLHRRRRALLVLAGGVGLLAAAIIAYGWIQIVNLEQVTAMDVAMRQVGMLVLVVGTGAVWASWIAGMMIGRTIARLVVTILLPPRLRTPLAVLWTSQGLAPPTTRPDDSHG